MFNDVTVTQSSANGIVDVFTAGTSFLNAAEADIDELDARAERAAKAEIVVVGTVLGDTLFSGLRRAAQEHVSALRYATPPAAEV